MCTLTSPLSPGAATADGAPRRTAPPAARAVSVATLRGRDEVGIREPPSQMIFIQIGLHLTECHIATRRSRKHRVPRLRYRPYGPTATRYAGLRPHSRSRSRPRPRPPGRRHLAPPAPPTPASAA